MTTVNRNNHLLTVLAAALLCACAAPARKMTGLPLSAAPARTETAARKEPEAPPPPSPEDLQKVESLYYKAVGAYSSNDMGAAQKYLDEISTLYPSYQPAAELRGKVKLVSGSGQNLPPPRQP